MRFIGADLHKQSITLCVVELVEGKSVILDRPRFHCRSVERIEKFLKAQGPCALVVESTIGYEWFVELAEKVVDRVVLAHAAKLKVIAESTRKTDKIDAFVLAEFLAKDMIPEAWRPTPRVRQYRALVRRACKVKSRITSVKNTIHGILTRYNADRRDAFTRLGWDAVQRVKLLKEDRWVLEDLWEELEQLRERKKKIYKRLDAFAASAPTAEAEARAVLATMPGVGKVTVDVLLAELGDIRRFHSADAVASYAGLDPGVRSSAGKRHDLKLTKAGSPLLRWIMIQLAHRKKRSSARWEKKFEQISRRAGKKKATCALARQLLLVIYAMLRDGQAYRLPAA